MPDHWAEKSVKLVEGEFLNMFPGGAQFDAVVTLFLFDISENMIEFLSNTYRLLKPGDLWVILGRTVS